MSTEISVVLGVRDAAGCIEPTLESVLDQRDVDLECVVVDDGSRDATARRVARVARADPRVRLIRQAACGLTRALVTGCSEARGALVARIDAGDRMLDGRLAAQRDALAAEPGVALVASAFRLVGPRGERISEVPERRDGDVADLTEAFRGDDAVSMSGIGHMTVCFRREAYRAAGGYRLAFGLAQDVDLWSRMAGFARLLRLPAVLTEARVGAGSLSPRHHRTQLRLRELAARAARARRDGRSESPMLAAAAHESRVALASARRGGAAAYLVGACLARDGDHDRAARYFRDALEEDPTHLRARLRLARSGLARLVLGHGAAT